MNTEIIDTFDKVLDQLLQVFSSFAVSCVGGFPRDLLNNKTIKDVDFLLTTEPSRASTNAYLKSFWEQKSNHSYTPKKDGTGFKVLKHKKYNADIIITESPPNMFIRNTFDFGICQIFMTCEGDMYASRLYLEDIKNKTLTLSVRESITSYQLGYAIKDHLPRLQQKYPDHKLNVVWDSHIENNFPNIKVN